MKIISANVNGIRAAHRKGFFDWLKVIAADIVCIQEIKAQEDQLDYSFYPKEYYVYYHPAQRKGYSGVAIYTKEKPNIINKSIWEDIDYEGRLLSVDFNDLTIMSLYLPSGSAKQERQDYKMEFLTKRFMPYLKELAKNGRKYIICGDFNIAHKKIDIKNWYANQKNSGFLPEERAWMSELFNKSGFVDAFRVINNEEHQYTWWSNRGKAWENNVGWRIDYQVITENLKDKVKEVAIYKKERFSDHSPLIINYDL